MKLKGTVLAFQAIVKGDGALLGGMFDLESSPFLLLENAEKWADTVVQVNRDAGRKVLGVEFRTVRAPLNWTV